jgi:hypothetical protein
MAAAVLGATGSAAAVGLGLWHGAQQPLLLALALLGAATSALSIRRGARVAWPRRGARPVAMAIVPWGVHVAPETDPRVLRWPAVRRVTVDVTHTLRGGTPDALASVVTVFTEREVLAGRAPGAVPLEALLANLAGYSAEAARPAAADLDGLEPLAGGAAEPAAKTLLAGADALCRSADGAARLRLPAGDYRHVALRAAGPETLEVLRAALAAGLDAPADPRPLASVVTALLGARELVPDLVRLVSSPHPLVAACAKASALRLGAPQSRAGSVEEVEAFLFAEDFELLDAWSRGG